MTDTTPTQDEILVRLDAITAQLEQLGVAPASLEVSAAAINPDGTPGLVAPGELIESAWGNAVSNSIGKLKVAVQSGVTFATTDTNGLAAYSFQRIFPTTPNVVANVISVVPSTLVVVINTVNTGGFTARISDQTGGPFVGSVNVSWIAALTTGI